MSIPCKFERSILSHDEHELILRSHHPEIYDVALADLKVLRARLRDMRNKERTLARENSRAVRGKGAQRGASFPGTVEHVCCGAQARGQGDRPHGEARGADRACGSGAPRARHASRGFVSSPSCGRRHGRRRHASVAERAAAHASPSRPHRQGVAGDQECAGRSRRAQQRAGLVIRSGCARRRKAVQI